MNETKSRPTPNSKEAEMMVLGSMMSAPHALNIGTELLKFSDFYFLEHQTIFDVLKTICKKGKPVDIHFICEELKNIDKLKKVGGPAYITGLAQYAGTSAYIEEYCNTIRTHAFARQQIDLSQSLCNELLDKKNNPFSILEKYQQKQANLAKQYAVDDKISIGGVLNGIKTGSPSLASLLKERQEYYRSHGKLFSTGISTGFVDLDANATLLEDSHLIVVAGRPSMGKTTFALNIAEHVCISLKLPVAIFSLEMGAEQLAEKIISSQSSISLTKMKQGTFGDTEFDRIQKAIDRVQVAPLYIYDQGVSTVSNIVSRARQLKDREGVRLIIIDYLQLLGVDGGGDSRQYEVAEVSRRLKLLAMELQIPILCVAQLSRKVEERAEKRPLMSDLRDSGQIEQDADAIVFLYRRDYYNKDDHPGKAEVIIAKNRHGPTSTSYLSFQQEHGRFHNLTPMSVSRQGISLKEVSY